MTTKQKIMQEAKKQFNRNGFLAVTLFELAQKMNMSRGNLTYHFKDKNQLLEALVVEMWQKLEEGKIKSRSFPSFKNLHNEVQLLYKIQKEYAFIFLDAHVLRHPSVRKKFRAMTQQMVSDNKAVIAFSIQLGNMKPEPFPGAYNHLAFTVWMQAFFWLAQQTILGKKTTGEEGEKIIWSTLLPHFTKKGIASFQSFFGEEYFNNLGDPFRADLDVSF